MSNQKQRKLECSGLIHSKISKEETEDKVSVSIKTILQIEGEIKTFLDKQKLKESVGDPSYKKGSSSG